MNIHVPVFIHLHPIFKKKGSVSYLRLVCSVMKYFCVNEIIKMSPACCCCHLIHFDITVSNKFYEYFAYGINSTVKTGQCIRSDDLGSLLPHHSPRAQLAEPHSKPHAVCSHWATQCISPPLLSAL